MTDVVLGRPIQENHDYFCSSVFIYADMHPIYVFPTFILTDDFTEWAVYLGSSGKAFVALWLGFVCVCPCVGTMSLAATER